MILRLAERQLHDWLTKKARKPMVLRGARQVGKTTLVRQFAKEAGLTLNEVNLERHLLLDEIFRTTNTEQICRELEALLGRDVRKEGSLLFLDEIQATPHALMALRYFLEDLPNLPVIAAGSLLEFTLADHSFSMPVGRIDYLHLYPLTFNEFLAALEPTLLKYVDELDLKKGIPQVAHDKLLKRQRQYFLVGGMPEAVTTFKETDSFLEVSQIHAAIVNTYLDDFAKYGRKQDLPVLQKIFTFIPRNLGRKVKYSNIDRDIRAAKVKEGIHLLTMARVCHRVHHSHCTGLPLQAETDDNIYKLLFLDIGLANHVCGLDWQAISAMNEQKLINEGGLAEQFIGQHLIDKREGGAPPQLHYWLREKKGANAEVDFVTSFGDLIVPVEVKAGKSGTLKSLHYFIREKGASIAVRFDLNPPSSQGVSHPVVLDSVKEKVEKEQVVFFLISLPLYAVGALPKIIDRVRGMKFCAQCGNESVLRNGPTGKFWGCSTYPKCTHTETYRG
ncbi:MAG: AAA family ATPase [Thermodesulfobacteriota bacterium]